MYKEIKKTIRVTERQVDALCNAIIDRIEKLKHENDNCKALKEQFDDDSYNYFITENELDVIALTHLYKSIRSIQFD